MASKKYGLLLPDKIKKPPVFQASRNVFGDDSDSEGEVKKRPSLLQLSNVTKRKAKNTQDKAVSEDPTVYQYDEIYDDIVNKKQEAKVKTKVEKKPQYIENLMKAANKRKIENERRMERQIQKEREKEGDEFQDKEVFVTSAYKKKLEEMKLEEEKEKREEYLENIGDVTKQKDLGGFYRHLYEQKLGKDKDPPEQDVKENDSKTPDANEIQAQKKRNYRKRKSSDSKIGLSEGEIVDSDEEINRVNLDDIRLAKKQKLENIDADSDFSDDPSDEETEKPAIKPTESVPETNEIEKVSESEKPKKAITEKPKDEVEEVPKPTIDIWKKRTVGQAFEDALKRYYERKAARG